MDDGDNAATQNQKRNVEVTPVNLIMKMVFPFEQQQ
jgi:hypothetical protein